MADNRIYQTIAKRTGGNIYIGVVGPVRSGKSTFIHKFMENVVIPNIENEYDRSRTTDELPQSGSGRTITTTEPKFIPSEAVEVNLGDGNIKIRMIDCVGYMVRGALGASENDEERRVMTPWSDEAIPFSLAGELGTERVVKEHSTIAVLVTTDGSICDIAREEYAPPEERIVRELKEANVPFAIILNSAHPESEGSHKLARELEEKYSAPVALLNCTELNCDDAREIVSMIIGEFPISEVKFKLPDWFDLLPEESTLATEVNANISIFADNTSKLSDIKPVADKLGFANLSIDGAAGSAVIDVPTTRESFYSELSQASGLGISSDRELFECMSSLAAAGKEYEKIKDALRDANEFGYGIVMPSAEDVRVSEPKVIKQGGGYGIQVSASADTIHMIRADIKADICPLIGSEEQADEIVKLMLLDYEENPKKLLHTKMLGRTLYDLAEDGMNAKLLHLPSESREKLGKTLERIINEGANGLVCILI